MACDLVSPRHPPRPPLQRGQARRPSNFVARLSSGGSLDRSKHPRRTAVRRLARRRSRRRGHRPQRGPHAGCGAPPSRHGRGLRVRVQRPRPRLPPCRLQAGSCPHPAGRFEPARRGLLHARGRGADPAADSRHGRDSRVARYSRDPDAAHRGPYQRAHPAARWPRARHLLLLQPGIQPVARPARPAYDARLRRPVGLPDRWRSGRHEGARGKGRPRHRRARAGPAAYRVPTDLPQQRTPHRRSGVPIALQAGAAANARRMVRRSARDRPGCAP